MTLKEIIERAVKVGYAGCPHKNSGACRDCSRRICKRAVREALEMAQERDEAKATAELSRIDLERNGRCDRCGVSWDIANYQTCPVCVQDMAHDALAEKVKALIEARALAEALVISHERRITELEKEKAEMFGDNIALQEAMDSQVGRLVAALVLLLRTK